MRSVHVLLLLLGAAAVLLASATTATTATKATEAKRMTPEPVKAVNLTQYKGVWHMVYGDAADVFNFGGRCISATYTARADGTLGVYNEQYKQGNAVPDTIRGKAFVDPRFNRTSKLCVRFDNGLPPGGCGEYWIVQLGPEVRSQYSYAVVTDSTALTLFVLARNVTLFELVWEKKVLLWLAENGFNTWLNTPLKVNQTACPAPLPPAAAAAAVAAAPAPVPVASLNLTAYLGTWWQVYGDLFEELTFEGFNASCTTARYALEPRAGNVSVLNSQLNSDGTRSTIRGYAYYANAAAKGTGELTVHLNGVPADAPYWILLLGPLNARSGLDEYAVVSDPLRYTLFVLVREPERFFATGGANARVLDWLKHNGFTSLVDSPVVIPYEHCPAPPTTLLR
jgi:lipocalin